MDSSIVANASGIVSLLSYVNKLTIGTARSEKWSPHILEVKVEMKNDRNVIGRWSGPYLDSVELLYGAFDLHPNLTVAEVCEEWQECLRADKPRPGRSGAQ